MTIARRRALLVRTGSAALALLAAAACEHAALTAPGNGTRTPPPLLSAAIRCTADLRASAVACDDGASGGAGSDAAPSLVYGGQSFNVRVRSSNAAYDPTSGAFTFDVTVQNLLPQPIGTGDGTTPDAGGVRVFMTADPAVTSGNGGSVTPAPDGRATFTASAQPYWQFDG